MKGTAHRASTAHPAITFIGRLALAALILVVLGIAFVVILLWAFW